MVSRALSLLVALQYLSGAPAPQRSILAFQLLFPLAAIWFPEPIGRYAAPLGQRIAGDGNPAFLVALLGWLLLLLPVVPQLLEPIIR